MPRDEVTTLDILRAARQATTFIAGMSKDEFLSDAKTQSAVLHQLLVIGEAVKGLPRTFETVTAKLRGSKSPECAMS